AERSRGLAYFCVWRVCTEPAKTALFATRRTGRCCGETPGLCGGCADAGFVAGAKKEKSGGGLRKAQRFREPKFEERLWLSGRSGAGLLRLFENELRSRQQMACSRAVRSPAPRVRFVLECRNEYRPQQTR